MTLDGALSLGCAGGGQSFCLIRYTETLVPQGESSRRSSCVCTDLPRRGELLQFGVRRVAAEPSRAAMTPRSKTCRGTHCRVCSSAGLSLVIESQRLRPSTMRELRFSREQRPPHRLLFAVERRPHASIPFPEFPTRFSLVVMIPDMRLASISINVN